MSERDCPQPFSKAKGRAQRPIQTKVTAKPCTAIPLLFSTGGSGAALGWEINQFRSMTSDFLHSFTLKKLEISTHILNTTKYNTAILQNLTTVSRDLTLSFRTTTQFLKNPLPL